MFSLEMSTRYSRLGISLMFGVVVGDVPSYRVDNMPYGGVKDSGLKENFSICNGGYVGNIAPCHLEHCHLFETEYHSYSG